MTEIQKLLSGYLQNTSLSDGDRALVYMTLQNDDQMLEMCRFLSKHIDAKAEEIMAKASAIAEKSRESAISAKF